MKHRTHEAAMAEVYQSHPAYALELLNSVLADGDQAELLVVLRQLAKAFGGVQAIAARRTLIRRKFTERCRPRATRR